MRSIRDEIKEVITNLPGVTTNDIVALMPHVSYSSLTARLNGLYVDGTVTRKSVPAPAGTRGRTTVYAYEINPTPAAPAHKVRRTLPTDSAMQARIDNLEAVVKELRAWKANAIARFPDLDVDPVVLEARKIVADEIAGSDPHLASQVRAGQKDGILPMRVTMAALNKAA